MSCIHLVNISTVGTIHLFASCCHFRPDPQIEVRVQYCNNLSENNSCARPKQHWWFSHTEAKYNSTAYKDPNRKWTVHITGSETMEIRHACTINIDSSRYSTVHMPQIQTSVLVHATCNTNQHLVRIGIYNTSTAT